MAADQIDGPTLRRLLAELLPLASDFDAFCLDFFPAVHRQFGNGMERTQKENLLLQQTNAHTAIAAALRKSFAQDPVWASLDHETRAETEQPTDAKAGAGKTRLYAALVCGGLILVTASLWGVMSVRRTHKDEAPAGHSRAVMQTDCGSLALDDVFVIKELGADAAESIQLDLRLRHTGASAGTVNVSRVFVDCTDRKEERSPVAVSASYDLLIRGEHNEAALAQQLKSGEVDRVMLRLGFTQESAAYQYTARVRLQYNGACSVESAPFTLSRDAARHPALAAPWPGK